MGTDDVEKQSLGALAGSIAHDFNNILTIILGNLAFVKIREDPDDTGRLLDDIEKAVLRARGLSQQLLTLSKGGSPVKNLIRARCSEKEPLQEDAVKNKGKVLVMEDEPGVRNVLGRMLEKLGYAFEFACDGSGALKLYGETGKTGGHYNAIIMDLTIPGGMDGKETIRQLRAMDPEVRVIASSGYSNVGIMKEYKKYGFNAALAKPYTVEELEETLNSVSSGQ